MNLTKSAAQFCIGGGAYVGLELVYRGRSHASMFAAGGVCFLLLGQVAKRSLSPAVQALMGAGLITGVELAAGLLFNRSYQVWDYRDQPGNLMGQVCPLFTLLWIPVGIVGSALYRWTDQMLSLLPNAAGSGT